MNRFTGRMGEVWILDFEIYEAYGSPHEGKDGVSRVPVEIYQIQSQIDICSLGNIHVHDLGSSISCLSTTLQY